MITFREFILEYKKGLRANILNPNPDNSFNKYKVRAGGTHNVAKKYKHADPILSNIIDGQVKSKNLYNAGLLAFLKKYNMIVSDLPEGKPVTKNITNSRCKITLLKQGRNLTGTITLNTSNEL